MTPIARRISLVLVAAACGLAAAAQQPSSDIAARGMIVGQVVDAGSGKPLSGVMVNVGGPLLGGRPAGRGGPEPASAWILTTGDGFFVFRGLPPGTYLVAAQKPGYAEGASGRMRPGGTAQPITLEPGARVGDLIVRVWKDGVITGTVADEAGEPLVNAHVRCWFRGSASGQWRACGAASSTDDRGVYRLPALVPGQYLVGAAGRTVGWYSRGNVFVPSAVPAPSPAEGGLTPMADGRFWVHPPTFHPSAASPARAAIVDVGSGEERSGIDVQLNAVPAVRVTGLVASADNPSGYFVRLARTGWEESGLLEDSLISRVRADGSFSFAAVPAGQYALRATLAPPSRRSSEPLPSATWADVPLTVDGTTHLDGQAIALRRGAIISGQAEFDGVSERPPREDLQRMQVEIESAGFTLAPVNAPSVRIDDTGAFRSVGLAPGRYYVRVLASPRGWMFKSATTSGRDASIVPVDIGENDVSGVTLTFTDRWTSLTGQVATADGAPDSGAVVLAFPTDTDLWAEGGLNPRRMRSARPDAGGAYSMRSIPAGDYYVIAVPDSQSEGWRDRRTLETLARQAGVVTVFDGEHKAHNLRTQEVR